MTEIEREQRGQRLLLIKEAVDSVGDALDAIDRGMDSWGWSTISGASRTISSELLKLDESLQRQLLVGRDHEIGELDLVHRWSAYSDDLAAQIPRLS